MAEKKDFVQVLSLHKDTDLVIVKSMLEAHNVDYYVANENFSKTYGGIGVSVFVVAEQADQAKDILTSFL